MIPWIRHSASSMRTGVWEFGSQHLHKNQAMWPPANPAPRRGGKQALWTSTIYKVLGEREKISVNKMEPDVRKHLPNLLPPWAPLVTWVTHTI